MAPDKRGTGRSRKSAQLPAESDVAAQEVRPKHPDVPGAVVRLTDDAVDDLDGLFAQDPQIVRWALKKMLMLERDPNAGEPLLAGLIGWRKIIVGDRDWRIVWRVDTSEVGRYYVDVAEVWAVGYRKDFEVYGEVKDRIAAAGDSPLTKSLTEVVERFGKTARDVHASPEPEATEPVPKWLKQVLKQVVGLRDDEVDALTFEEASIRWEAYTTGQGR